MTEEGRKATSRQESNATMVPTAIWQETPKADNPFLAEQVRCHGYDLMQLLPKCSYPEMLFLLFRGELPSEPEAELLEKLMMAFINPGPRHPATYAAMNAGVGRTRKGHILPIGLEILSGEHLGGEEVQKCMKFLAEAKSGNPTELAAKLIVQFDSSGIQPHETGDIHPVPGFGTHFGDVDPMSSQIAEFLGTLAGSGETMEWAKWFATGLGARNMGWLPTGVVAAVLCDLGFHYHAGPGLYQIISAPGILAHGLEMAKRNRLEFPFPTGENFVIQSGEAT